GAVCRKLAEPGCANQACKKPATPLNFADSDAGWSSLAARRAHNPKVAGSNPAPATRSFLMQESLLVRLFCWPQGCAAPCCTMSTGRERRQEDDHRRVGKWAVGAHFLFPRPKFRRAVDGYPGAGTTIQRGTGRSRPGMPWRGVLSIAGAEYAARLPRPVRRG